MNGIDVLIFTAGLGENDRAARELIADNMDYLGMKYDAEKNYGIPSGEAGEISTDDSPVKILVIPTDEELLIAQDTYELTK